MKKRLPGKAPRLIGGLMLLAALLISGCSHLPFIPALHPPLTAEDQALVGLLKEGDSPERWAAAQALGRKDLAGAVQPLIEALQDAHPRVRGSAALALGRIGRPAVNPLIKTLKNRDAPHRWEAAEALGYAGSARAVPSLRVALVEDGIEIREMEKVARALERLGAVPEAGEARIAYLVAIRSWDSPELVESELAFGILLSALDDPNPVFRGQAAVALGRLGDPRAAAHLMELYDDGDRVLQHAVIGGLVNIETPEVDEFLATLFIRGSLGPKRNKLVREALDGRGWKPANRDHEVAQLIAGGEWEKVASIGEPALNQLFRTLASPVSKDRIKAAETLGAIGDPRAAMPLFELLRDDDIDYVQRAAAGALGAIGSTDVVDPLIAELEGGKTERTWLVAQALGKIGDRRAVEPLIDFFKKNRGLGSSEIVTALGDLGDPAAVEPLIRFINSEDNFIGFSIMRDRAVEALGKIGKPALMPLLESFSDKSSRAHPQKAKALGEIGDARAVDALLEALEDPDHYLREASIVALGKIGDPRAADPLLSVLQKGNRRERERAVQALVGIDDPRVWKGLAEFENDTNEKVRKVVAGALRENRIRMRLTDERTEAPEMRLIMAMMDMDGQVRSRAARELKKTGWSPRNDIEKFYSLLEGYRWKEAASMGDAAIEPLIELLKSKDKNTYRGAISWLGFIGDERAVEPLQRMAEKLGGHDLWKVKNAINNILTRIWKNP